ncbi:MAG: aldo/keto reductase [Acidobacteria bacterium]|nr:aldo/keto reductase [Acidobacteriota bacterium]
MADRLSRRTFLGETALAGVAAAFAAETGSNAIPTRTLGKTGVKVTILAMGCGSRLLMYEKEDAAVEALNLALDLGVGYLDTAYGYGNGKSETWVGQVMKTRRKGVFLATKINARTGDDTKRILEGSMKRLQTDQVDLIHVHSLTSMEDLAKVEAKGSVLDVLYSLRDQKVTRFIGMTSHTDPTVLKTAIERHDINCVQMALNAALQGMADGKGKMILNPAMKTSFEQVALPAAQKKNLGILAMKVMGQEELLGPGAAKGDPAKLLQYTLSLPVTAAVVGMPKPEFIRQNVAWAKAFKPMPKAEMKEFSRRMADANKMALDLRFRNHIDA